MNVRSSALPVLPLHPPEQVLSADLLRQTIAIGGVRRDLASTGREALLAHLRRLEHDVDDLSSHRFRIVHGSRRRDGNPDDPGGT